LSAKWPLFSTNKRLNIYQSDAPCIQFKFKYLFEFQDFYIPLTSSDQIINSDSISSIIQFKSTRDGQLQFEIKLNDKIKIEHSNGTSNDQTDFDTGWINSKNLEKKLIIKWLTTNILEEKFKLENGTLNRTSNGTSNVDFEKIKIENEIENNKNRLIIDEHGNPRFIENIEGVTNDQNKIEFIVKFKYIRKTN